MDVGDEEASLGAAASEAVEEEAFASVVRAAFASVVRAAFDSVDGTVLEDMGLAFLDVLGEGLAWVVFSVDGVVFLVVLDILDAPKGCGEGHCLADL